MNTVHRRLRRVMQSAENIPFDKASKFIIMSDCHRGQGNTGDNFLANQVLHKAALEYYYKNGFTYIELGDGDELWENRKIQPIIDAHSDIFLILSKFYNKKRLYMLYGNHDIVKRRSRIADKMKHDIYCESCPRCLFPEIKIPEGLVLEEERTKRKILLVHGHQGSFINDTAWPVGRFLVRYFWKPLELIGFTAPTVAACSYKEHENVQKKFSAFAAKHKLLLIAGHTHRPAFPKAGRGHYFNDGCCVHPKSVTGIEIANGQIALVKWSESVREDLGLYVNREVLEGFVDIDDFYSF